MISETNLLPFMKDNENNMPLLRYRRVVGIKMYKNAHSEEPDFFSFLWFVLRIGIKGALLKTIILGVVLSLTALVTGGESASVSKIEALAFFSISLFFFTVFSANSVKTFLHPVIAKEKFLGTQHMLIEGQSIIKTGPMKPHALRFYPSVWFNVLNISGKVQDIKHSELNKSHGYHDLKIGDDWIKAVYLSDDIYNAMADAAHSGSHVDLYLYRLRKPVRLIYGLVKDLFTSDSDTLLSGSRAHLAVFRSPSGERSEIRDSYRPVTYDAKLTLTMGSIAFLIGSLLLWFASNYAGSYVFITITLASVLLFNAALSVMYLLDVRFGVKNLDKTTMLIRNNKKHFMVYDQ